VRHSGRSYAHPLVLITVTEGLSVNPRFGIITSKAIGNAVIRNRTRRRLRSILSNHLINFLHPHDIVVVARKPIVDASYQEIEEAISNLMRKAGLLG
jgi:ribonuclease P protein component